MAEGRSEFVKTTAMVGEGKGEDEDDVEKATANGRYVVKKG
jgi:hypothetical protein